MSLLSKKDHQLVIEALEALIPTKQESEKLDYVDLLFWIKNKERETRF